MKFIANITELNGALKKLSKVASDNTKTQPVLNNILIETIMDNQLKLTATNLDLTIETTIKAEIIESGSYTISAVKFIQIAASFRKQLTFELKDNTVEISEGKSIFNIPGIPAFEFPVLTELKETNSIQIDTSTLLEGFKKTVFGTAMYDSSSVLSGIYFSLINKNLEFASTNGNTLSIFRDVPGVISENKTGLIIPHTTASEIIKIGNESDKVKILINYSQICFDYGNTKVSSRLLNGNYPKYQQIIPVNFSSTATIDRQLLIDVLQKINIVIGTLQGSKTKFTAALFNFNNICLNVSYNSSEGNIKEDIICEYSGENLQIAFDFEYILKGLKVIDTDKVRFDMNSSLSAAVIRPDNDDSYLYLVMPVQVK